jgi:hypothetical protein
MSARRGLVHRLAGSVLALAAATASARAPAPASAASGAPRVEVALAPESVTVGDRIEAAITVRLPPGDARAPRFSDWSRGWGKLAVLAAPPAERSASPAGVEWRQRLVLAAFETGRLELPPAEIALGGAAQPLATPAGLAVDVRSVLPAGEAEPRPQPPEPPRPLPLPRAFWWTAGALAALALALGLLLARRRRAAAAASAEAALSPGEELARALAALAALEPAAAHAALSLALRRYLGRSLALPAACSTTSELAHRLAARGLERALVQRAVRLLRELDQVKFARRAATGDDLVHRIAEARAVADAVDSHLRPPAPAASGEASSAA